ncbi:ABC transporter ATP-binding protein [Paenibacillus sp. J2TS4]|uniref:ABC transporter ATP-binding protein n=1 Tax=Paenibacillus sp. J2TS4 TaxID=2807194 RepID=UPI001B192B65|nr:ABC transporter ATP-binding protein [Paenibacillus sp. J2TS4]GIP35795.1 sugar ABC transporter ATP-binding protein [Paenibacillus sp. J2TS4]
MLLQMEQITKKYGDFTANAGVDFALRKGEVHAVVGENGAGKTTLMRILYGMESPTSGAIRLRDQEVEFATPLEAIRSGIGMVHQHFMLFPSFTVAENIVAGGEPGKGIWFDRKQAEAEVKQLGDKYGMPVEPRRRVADCSVGMQQRVEILKVLYQGAEIIILDEPTAVLTPLEVKELLETIQRLSAQGKSIILITHKLHEVMEVADRITVLRNGRVTGMMEAAETNVGEVSRLMVGRELADRVKSRLKLGEAVLDVRELTVQGEGKPLLDQVSFQVKAGEIVGIAGVSGNGQSELLQALSGLRKADSGQIRLAGADVSQAAPGQVREAGLAHIPEDRYLWGAAKDASVVENAVMGHHSRYHRSGWLRKTKISAMVREWVDRFAVKTSSIDEKAQNLSGGNLQKLIVARELAQNTPFLIAAEPTRGVDIGAMEFIHDQLLRRREEQGAILLVSSELSEIMTLADRILVMFEGRIVGELNGEEATEEQIGLLMAGGDRA